MKSAMLNIHVYLVMVSLSVLLLLSNSAMAEGDGGWTSTASPGYIFQVEEDLFNNQKRLVMTVLKPDKTHEVHWGPASGSMNSSYLLESMNGESDMKATWQFNSVTQATVTVDSCTANCLWQPGQVVTLSKFFGDKKSNGTASRVPKTGQTGCWDVDGNDMDCKGTGQDGEYQLGVLPAVMPDVDNPYTAHGWSGTRFTDNHDGTVTDNFTGLIWTIDANCFGCRSWPQALVDCKNLASGSCHLTDGSLPGDWRLPNFNELRSLIDPTQPFPALPAGHPFVAFDKDYFMYWTSTTTSFWHDFANAVRVDDGESGQVVPKYATVCLVWAVRSGD